MLIAILGIGLGILGCVFFYKGYRDGANTVIILSLFALMIAIPVCISTICALGSYSNEYETEKKDIQEIHSQYDASNKTLNDWEWLIENCENHNQRISDIDETAYLIFDLAYIIEAETIHAEDYMITISDAKIEFPDEYKLRPLFKPDI